MTSERNHILPVAIISKTSICTHWLFDVVQRSEILYGKDEGGYVTLCEGLSRSVISCVLFILIPVYSHTSASTLH